MKLNEMDANLRRLSRHDPHDVHSGMRYLENLLRVEKTTENEIMLAAFLGHPAAKAWAEGKKLDLSPTEPCITRQWGGASWSDAADNSEWAKNLDHFATPIWGEDYIIQQCLDVIKSAIASRRPSLDDDLVNRYTTVLNMIDSSTESTPGHPTALNLSRYYEGGFEMGMRNMILYAYWSRNDPDFSSVILTKLMAISSYDKAIKEKLTNSFMPSFTT